MIHTHTHDMIIYLMVLCKLFAHSLILTPGSRVLFYNPSVPSRNTWPTGRRWLSLSSVYIGYCAALRDRQGTFYSSTRTTHVYFLFCEIRVMRCETGETNWS